jgi:hypothetical protein
MGKVKLSFILWTRSKIDNRTALTRTCRIALQRATIIVLVAAEALAG